MIHIIGLFTILLVIALFLYLVRKPLNITLRYPRRSQKQATSIKFQNDAPVAPDLLFGNTDYELPVYERIPPRPRFTPAPSKVEPTPFQAEIADILWSIRHFSSVFRDELDMVVYNKGKQVGLVRCIERGRIHIGHVQDVLKLAKELGLKTIYIVGLGRIDKAALKLAIRMDVKLIHKEKLDTLRARIPKS